MLLSQTIKHHQEKKSKLKWLLPVAILAGLLLTGIFSGFYIKNVIEKPNIGSSTKIAFAVKSGETLDEIAKNLESAKLIRGKFIFSLYMKASGRSGRIQAGDYKIAGNLNMKEVSGIITFGKSEASRITIPEGWTISQIGDYLEKQNVVRKTDFLAAAKYDPARDKYAYLADLKPGASLEGFLYPDTYELTKNADSAEIIKKMLDNFDQKFTQSLREKTKNSGMSTFEVVTLASIVEREVSSAADRKIVAGIFENRLNNDMPLESCATIQYVLGENKKQFSYAETHTTSPYNTYLNPGLPVGPIGNPSMMSIEAVLFPEKTNYFYFLTGNDGKTYFSVTLDEHNAKKAKYLP